MEIKDKCKVLFLADICLYNDYFEYDEYAVSMLQMFIEECYVENKRDFETVMDIQEFLDGTGSIVSLFSEGREQYEEVLRMTDSVLGNSFLMTKLLHDIGDDNINSVGRLAMLFCKFLRDMEEEMSHSAFTLVRQ